MSAKKIEGKELSAAKKSLLIYARVPLCKSDTGFGLKDQACNGPQLWAENFDTVSVMMPVLTGLNRKADYICSKSRITIRR